jgi:hypothetical protein
MLNQFLLTCIVVTQRAEFTLLLFITIKSYTHAYSLLFGETIIRSDNPTCYHYSTTSGRIIYRTASLSNFPRAHIKYLLKLFLFIFLHRVFGTTFQNFGRSWMWKPSGNCSPG